MSILGTGTAICSVCETECSYLDIYRGGQYWTQWCNLMGDYVNHCPGCGADLRKVRWSARSDKPPFSPLAGYVPPKCTI